MYTYDEHKVLEQEWKIFKELCPESIMEILLNDDISFEDARKLKEVLEVLGFSAMAEELHKEKIEKHITEKNKQNFFVPSANQDEVRTLTRSFIDNIKSYGLKKTFAAAAHEEAYFQKTVGTPYDETMRVTS